MTTKPQPNDIIIIYWNEEDVTIDFIVRGRETQYTIIHPGTVQDFIDELKKDDLKESVIDEMHNGEVFSSSIEIERWTMDDVSIQEMQYYILDHWNEKKEL